MSTSRVALVHASPSSLSTMRRIVLDVPELTLAFEAQSVRAALSRLAAEPVELVLLALELSGDRTLGLAAVLATGARVLLVANDQAKEYARVYAALEQGALDVVDLPSVSADGQPQGVAAFRTKLVSMRRLLVPRGAPSVETAPRTRASVRPTQRVPLLAIGASTGGPNAIARVLADLPRPIDYAIVIVQHVDPAFSGTVASWIARASGVPVEQAQSGQRPERGTALIASTSDHLMLLANGTLAYTPEPRENPYRPSVDVFFGSVAAHHKENAVAVLLTGMGRDGAVGMQAMRAAGFTTLAQDEKTSVVWGMPRAAHEAGAVQALLPLERIGSYVAETIGRRRPSLRPKSRDDR